ncbi:MAG TPA: hypothetical protein VGO52_01970 [Hyphomonadaceae bacterium]|jgi:hypothetical protein|nr:hypothetical protein [Hyphomonadaceae bacterium]
MKPMQPGKGINWKLAVWGLLFLFIGAYEAVSSMTRHGWRRVEAQVATVSVVCHMRSIERFASDVDIPCETEDAFRAEHGTSAFSSGHLDWTTTRRVDMTLIVPGLQGEALDTSLKLWNPRGRPPEAGGKITVQQNLKDLTEVAGTDAAETSALIFAVIGVIGAVILAFAFGVTASGVTAGGVRNVKGGKPKGAARLKGALDGAADEADLAKRAEALIIAALAKSEAQSAAPAKPMPPQPAMATPAAARSSFGRKR